MARIGQKIKLSDTDHQELVTRSRSQRLDYRFVLRAKIILLCTENKTYDEIGSTLNIGRARGVDKVHPPKYLQYKLHTMQNSQYN